MAQDPLADQLAAGQVTDLEIIRVMADMGGSFIMALAALALAADPVNLEKIKRTWPDYWQKYRMIAFHQQRRHKS